jgi:hypothetical protein
LSCNQSYFFSLPVPVVGCDEEVFEITAGELTGLVSSGQLISFSEQALLWQLPAANQYFYFNGEGQVTLEFTDFEAGDQLEVVKDRLFWRKPAGLFEVAWNSNPINVVQLPEIGTLRQSRDYLLLEGSGIYYSKSFGQWQQTNLAEPGLEYLTVSQGILAHQPLGSTTYFEEAPGNFQLMTDPWAASSKIKVVKEIGGTKLLLVLRNSSNNPNTYQSTDYQSWQRVTFPSQPTYYLPVSQARAMPAGTLVEVTGKITVLPGWVSDSVGYVADGTGAIQYFLSSSNGQLLVDTYRQATVIGEISSSQVGRIILDELSHLVLAGPYQPSLPPRGIIESLGNLGQTALISGQLTSVSQDQALITDKSGSVKIHFQDIKDRYLPDSLVEISAVFDFNSSSGQVEAWYTGQRSKLLSAPSESVSATKPVVKTAVSSPAKLVNAAPAPMTVAVKTAPSLPEPDGISSLVGGKTTKAELPSWLILAAGLIGGVLIVRGRRFANIFD